MSFLLWLESESARTLLVTLAHTLWQGAAIGFLLLVLLRKIPASSPNIRYGTSLACLLALVISGCMTWSILSWEPTKETKSERAVAAHPILHTESGKISPVPYREEVPAKEKAVIPSHTIRDRNPWVPILLVLWILGAGLLTLRSLTALHGARRLALTGRIIEDHWMVEMVERLSRGMRLTRRIRIVVSERISSPAVVGVFKAALLVPASMLTGASPEALTAVLAHELAHIRRYDYLVNVLQLLIESVLFFNPAVWWISRQIRIEREACCDAMAVRLTGICQTSYARILADMAQSMGGLPGRPALAFSRDTSGSLLDRVKRLAIPSYRASVKLPWPSLIGLFLICLLLLACIGKGASLGVDLAAKILTPEERQEKLVEIQEEYGSDAVRYRQEREDSVTFSGRFLLPDGSPAGKIRYHFHVANGIHHSTAARETDNNGRFQFKSEAGLTWFSVVTGDDYAALFTEPFVTTEGQSVENLEFHLENGYEVLFKVQDTRGNPVASAEIGLMARLGSGTNIEVVSGLTSDQEGLVRFEQCVDLPLDIQAFAEGFMPYQEKSVSLEPNSTHLITLPESEPAFGVVRDRESGEPIPDAKIYLLNTTKPARNYTSDPYDRKKVFAGSDSEGRFTLEGLSDDGEYLFLIRAEGFAPTFLREALPGRKDLLVEMGPEIVVSGKVIWPEEAGKRRIQYRNPYKNTPSSTHSYEGQDIEIEEKGNVSLFTITGLWEGELVLSIGDRHFEYNLTESMTDLDFDMVGKKAEEASRDIVIRLTTPEGFPAPSGRVHVWANAEEPSIKSRNLDLDVDQEGKAEAAVPVPGKVNISSQGLVGYWFKPFNEAVPVGDGPYELTVPVTPAGSIYGRITSVTASDYEQIRARLIQVEMPDGLSRYSANIVSGELPVENEKYTFSPLPLGGRYQILASAGSNRRAISEVITINKEHPFQEVDLFIPKGIVIRGRVELPDGSPAVGLKAQLGMRFENTTHWATSDETDSEGRYEFRDINPDMDAEYEVGFHLRKDYVPVRMKIDPKKPLPTVRLNTGEVLVGRVVEQETGLPVADASVSAHEVPGTMVGDALVRFYQQASSRRYFAAEFPTNASGEFRFSNLDKGNYFLSVSSARQPSGAERKFYSPGDEDVVLEVLLDDDSPLKPPKEPRAK